MGERKKYDLIGLDNKCILTGKNINMSSPDITLILDAFENNKNPTELFLNENNELNGNIIGEKLNNLCENLENIKVWLDRTLIPSLQMMNIEDVRKCIPTIGFLDNKIYQLGGMTRKIKKQYNKKRISRPQKCYEALCPVCNKFFYLKNTNDWLQFEEHDHIAELLSSGDVFKLPMTEDDNTTTELDNCNETNKSIVKIEDLKNKTNDNSETNAKKFVKNTLPLCKYNAQVRNMLYPLHLTSNVCSAENNYRFYTIQAITNNRYQCLVCKSDMHQDKCVYDHVSGNKHRNKITDRFISSRVMNYHSIFSSLPHEIQIHQVVFRPSYKIEFLFCKVCALQINGEKVVQHINTDMHRIRLNTKRFSKYNFFDDMLKSIGMDPCNSEEDSSELSIQSQLIYNSESKMKAIISGTEALSLNDDKADSLKESGSTDEDEESDEETSETSSKSQSATEENVVSQAEEPLQGPSNMNTIVVTKKVTPKKSKDVNAQANGKSTKSENQQNNENKPIPIKHNIVPAFKEIPQNMFDYLENRYQIHLDYIKFINSIPQCTLCMKNLPKPVKDIKSHFASLDHKKNAEIHCGKQKFTYYCDLCYKIIRNETKWSEHLSCIEHRQRVDAIQKSKEPRGGSFREYECTTCNLVLYGNNATINKHLKENFGTAKRGKKVKEIKLPIPLSNLMRNDQIFAEEIYKLSKESMEVLKSIELSWECCRGIEIALEPIFGQCKAYPFGSRVSGLGNLVSDLDVFVDTGLMYEGMFNQDSESQSRLVSQTTRALKKHKDFVDVFAIPNARTPIVQVFHKATGLDCDLSFRHGLSVENTEFLRLCIDVQPKLKTLILFLKRWSYFCKLSDRISTYALAMLCIFYFQQKGLLPSVKTLREIDPTECKVIAGWHTFCYKKPLAVLITLYPPCNQLTKDILSEFFEFYMKFKFNIEVVCPLLGNTVLKADFYEEKGKRLPQEMKTYVTKINESEENEVFRSMSPMCIQDPFDLSHNLTKACPVDLVKRFVTLCQLSHATLCKKG